MAGDDDILARLGDWPRLLPSERAAILREFKRENDERREASRLARLDAVERDEIAAVRRGDPPAPPPPRPAPPPAASAVEIIAAARQVARQAVQAELGRMVDGIGAVVAQERGERRKVMGRLAALEQRLDLIERLAALEQRIAGLEQQQGQAEPAAEPPATTSLRIAS